MSADNTIIVVKTSKENEEYRYFHMLAAGNLNLEHKKQDNWDFCIKNAKVYPSLETAMKAAEELEKVIGFVEYGVLYYGLFLDPSLSENEGKNMKDEKQHSYIVITNGASVFSVPYDSLEVLRVNLLRSIKDQDVEIATTFNVYKKITEWKLDLTEKEEEE